MSKTLGGAYMTAQDIKARLAGTDSQIYLQGFSEEDNAWSLQAYIASCLNITLSKVGAELGTLYYKSPFPFIDGTEDNAARRVRKIMNAKSYPREWLFQLCIHLGLSWAEAWELFSEHLNIPFTNFGCLEEIVYEYCISRGYSIQECYTLLTDIKNKYDSSAEKIDSLNEQQRAELRNTELAKRQTMYINARYSDEEIAEKDIDNFREFMRELYPYLHSVRVTALRDYNYILRTPIEISAIEDERFLNFINEKNVFLLHKDQAKSIPEIKRFDDGRSYIARYNHNAEPNTEKLASILCLATYIQERDDDYCEFATDDEECAAGERLEYKKETLKKALDNILVEKQNVTRELLIVSMLLNGFNKESDINSYLTPDENGFQKLDVTRKFDAIVYETIKQTENEKSRLAAFSRFCENTKICKYECVFQE
jgi:hypothetical protein